MKERPKCKYFLPFSISVHCHSGFKKCNQWHFTLNHAAAEIRLMGVEILCEVIYLGLIQHLF